MALREGYTTGTCAAIASKAAARMIFEKRRISGESVETPSGRVITAKVIKGSFDGSRGSCAVKKDAGDDPDVTDKMLIFSEVRLRKEKGINIDGGEGVGRVTKRGLSQSIGEAAINKVPRDMIEQAVAAVFKEQGYEGGADIVISVPGGREIAEKTFNPRLGIEGGISILGTSGIVKPMSEDAVIGTIKSEISIKRAEGVERLILTPGNYGRDFLREYLNYDIADAVLCSNHVGAALDAAVEAGFKDILLIGSAGKLIKLAGGIMNTHNRTADCRMEILAANAAFFTGETKLLRDIMLEVTTEGAFERLEEAGILEEVMKRVGERALHNLKHRIGEESAVTAGLIIFSNERGILYEDKPYRSGTG